MAKTFPTDRFDSIPADLTRVGAHRSVPKRGRGWIGFAWAALATGILVAAGAIAITLFANSLNFALPFSSLGASSASDGVSASPTPSVVETADPILDSKVKITVLNGTKTPRLANTVGDSLVAAGWGGAAVGVGSRASAASDTVKLTVVYYSDAANEGAARAIAQQLKVGTVKLGNEYPSVPITVLLGADYTHTAG